MDTSEEWSGLSAALQELGMLCGENNHQSFFKDKPRRSNGLLVSPKSLKQQNRHLLNNQLRNRPDLLPDVEVDVPLDECMKNSYGVQDSENTENSFSINSSKLGKTSDPKSCLTYCSMKSVPMSLSDVYTESKGLNVLKMNSDYITGVTIGTYGSSKDGLNRSDGSVNPVNHSNTTKNALSLLSLRHHHLRPYDIPRRREERVRTTSETAENGIGITPTTNVDTPFCYLGSGHKVNSEKMWGSLLKSRSLENVRIAENEVLQVPAHEVDSMSKRIQHLHVE